MLDAQDSYFFSLFLEGYYFMKYKKSQLLIGAHMSIQGGLENALIEGEQLDCTAIQMFTHSNRQWSMRELTERQIEQFRQTAERSTIESIVAHASYLLNLGSPNAETRAKSAYAVGQELQRCDQLGIPYLVIHPGARLTSSPSDCIARIADSVNVILAAIKNTTLLVFENMAGQGSTIGDRFEQLALIREKIEHKERIGFCFDTCHGFAAGYNFSTPDSYEQLWHDFDRILGLQHLKVIHMNDSKKAQGSHLDRHETIGHGFIGLEAFRLIMNDSRFFTIPKILETPKGTTHEEAMRYDQRNLATLKSLLSERTRVLLHVA